MANYEYSARSPEGQEVAGLMQADSEAAVLRSLEDKKLFPISVRVHAGHIAARGGKIRTRDLGIIYGQLADLLRSGVPIMRAMETLTRAAINPKLADLVRKVHDEVSAGRTLADTMAEHPAIFPPLHAAMVRAGERAGFLEDVLTNLSEFIERQDELRGRVRGAMIYPLLLMTIGAGAVMFILTVLVPKFRTMFGNMPLPLPSQIMFDASALFTEHWPMMLAAGVMLASGVMYMLKSQYGRAKWDRWRLKLPILGKVLRTVSITRFCRILGTMLANGVPILQALAISKDATGSTVMSASIDKAAENVRAGEPLAAPLAEGKLFPPEIVEMIAVAEESNQLEKVLVRIADTVDRRMTRQVDQAIRLIEPLILVMLAAIIGFVALGLMYPIFTMSQTMH